jgi:hypothetical protein
MIKFLARLFRGFHLIFGISAPPEGENERTFVFAWMGIIACIIGFAVFLLYVIPAIYFRK